MTCDWVDHPACITALTLSELSLPRRSIGGGNGGDGGGGKTTSKVNSQPQSSIIYNMHAVKAWYDDTQSRCIY
jgi:hypothetical protein